MKHFIQTLLILLISTSSFAQLEWEAKKSVPQYGRHAGASFEINGKLYIGCGRLANGSYTNDFWEFDPSTENWTQKADVPGGARFIPSAFSINGKGYFCLGLSSTNVPVNTLYEYDPVTNSWAQKTNFPGSARYGSAAFVIGDTAYVGTGSNGSSSYLSDFYMYVPSTNTWTSRASLPGGGAANCVAFSLLGNGYLGNKTTSSTRVPDNNFWKYTPSTNTWTAITSMPGSNRRLTSAFVLNNQAYVGGGTNSGSAVTTFLNDFYKYNPISDSWSYTTSNSKFTPKIDPELFCIGDSIAYGVTGFSANGSLSEVWSWELGQDTCDYYDTTFVQDTTFLTFNDTNFVAVQDTLIFTVNTASISQPDLVGMKVYPNPAGSELTIAIADYTQMSNYTLKMYNMLGVEVYSQTVNSATYTINTSTMGGAGTYYLEVYDSLNAKRGRKVIIIN